MHSIHRTTLGIPGLTKSISFMQANAWSYSTTVILFGVQVDFSRNLFLYEQRIVKSFSLVLLGKLQICE